MPLASIDRWIRWLICAHYESRPNTYSAGAKRVPCVINLILQPCTKASNHYDATRFKNTLTAVFPYNHTLPRAAPTGIYSQKTNMSQILGGKNKSPHFNPKLE